MKKFLRKYSILLLFLFMAAIVIVMVVMTSITVSRSSAMIIESASRKLVSGSIAVSELATGEELDELKNWDTVKDDPALLTKYLALKSELAAIAEVIDVEIAYFLYLNPDDGLMYFLMDNAPIEDMSAYNPSEWGGVAREAVPDAVMATKMPQSTEFGTYSDAWENYLTAYAPVLDADGNVVALAGVDAEDILILDAKANSIILTVVLVLSVVALLVTGCAALLMFRRKAALAESANTAKSSFLSRMSHEMRTPMNAVMGLCRMAKETDDPVKKNEYLDNIAAASKHLRQVIDDILDLSKIESGKAVQEFVEVDFYKELANVEVIIRTAAEAKNQKLILDVDKNIPKKLVCDTTHLRQVVLNLLSNAIKFTPDGGEVSLTIKILECDDCKCNLLWQVRDNGIGIDKEYADKLFRPFEQGDNSTTRKFGGTGLGLAISKQYIDMMGGNITVKSEKGKGSTFTFNSVLYLPGGMTTPFTPCEDNEVYERPDLTGRHILLVEDAELNRIIAEDLFSGYGAEVDIAIDGQEGYEKFCANPDKYDIIFMDIQMPVLDGYSASKKIRASEFPAAKTVPIVAMTADVFREDVEKALAAGMNAHVGKPFDVEQIERAICKVLKSAGQIKS